MLLAVVVSHETGLDRAPVTAAGSLPAMIRPWLTPRMNGWFGCDGSVVGNGKGGGGPCGKMSAA